MSTSGGLWRALRRGIDLGCDIVQIFVKNNMQWFGKPCSPSALKLFANQLAYGKLASVFGHTGYLINLASPPSPNRDKSIQSLIQEIQSATTLGLPFLVMHPGAHLGAGEKAGLKQIVAGLNQVFQATKNSAVRIALENTAGQGTCLGARFEELHYILAHVRQPERLGICLDTCHVLAAGYGLDPEPEYRATIREFHRLIGLSRLKVFHLNDSLKPHGSRVDRHAHIGRGHVGLESFRRIVNDPRFRNRPMILETPKEHDECDDMDPINLAVLRDLLAPVRA